MANKQRVSCNNMQKDADALAEAIADLPKEIERIQQAMGRLSACWEGPAWGAYQDQVRKDMETMSEIYKVLVALQQGLGKAKDAYYHAEYDVYTDFRNMWI